MTNEQYNRCVAQYACIGSGYATFPEYNGSSLPVVGIDWYDAQNYCTWAGGQLPTEAQWEFAARGHDGNFFPWGNNAPNCRLDHVENCGGDPISVFKLPTAGQSWVGAVGMAGNASEWVADWYDFSYYSYSPELNPIGPESGEKKVVRGGAWSSNAITGRSARRAYLSPDHRYAFYGFRCVVSEG